jgi:polyferredoxin
MKDHLQLAGRWMFLGWGLWLMSWVFIAIGGQALWGWLACSVGTVSSWVKAAVEMRRDTKQERERWL